MAVDIVCPDCGGIIGGAGADGRRACSCVITTPSKHDTVRIDLPLPDVNESKKKVCITCGKDLAGHRRVKDSRGYQCLACAKEEMAAEKEGTVRCAECGRRVKPQGLVDYDKIKICKRCFNDHKELKKKAVKKIATRHYEIHEKKTLMYLAIAAAVLLCLALYGYMRS
jgi:DNA-directed RNA polymerase subunit RPC12/RpoP